MSYIDKLEGFVKEGLTTREMGNKVGMSKSVIQYQLTKLGLNSELKHSKPIWNEQFFSKIDTPESAYILGFMLGDAGYRYNAIDISVALKDKCVVDYIANQIGGNVRVDNTLDKKTRRFPRASLCLGNKNMLIDLGKVFVTRKKKERKIPIINPHLERYLLLGFFDAEGCLTWGRRKDRNRIWHKISFTSAFDLLVGIQKILDKQDIPSQLRPKTGEDCYVLEFSSKKRVLSFLDYLYDDGSFIVLPRKYDKAKALRLELGENGEAA